jgi:hypothetical protein
MIGAARLQRSCEDLTLMLSCRPLTKDSTAGNGTTPRSARPCIVGGPSCSRLQLPGGGQSVCRASQREANESADVQIV